MTKRFGGLIALKDVSFSSNEQILGIIGPNGAGKTTLFNIISGVYKPTKGEVFFEGKAISGESPHVICRRGVSRTYQIPRPFSKETVTENVLVAGLFGRTEKTPKKELLNEVDATLELVGLSEKADSRASALNLHQRRMLEVARSLITKPRLLLLDEIASGLTPSEADNVITKIRDISKRGVEILWIEHVMRTVMRVSASIVVLDHGEIISRGTPKEVASDSNVIKAYLGVNNVTQS